MNMKEARVVLCALLLVAGAAEAFAFAAASHLVCTAASAGPLRGGAPFCRSGKLPLQMAATTSGRAKYSFEEARKYARSFGFSTQVYRVRA